MRTLCVPNLSIQWFYTHELEYRVFLVIIKICGHENLVPWWASLITQSSMCLDSLGASNMGAYQFLGTG